jgi:assimilatory nitrate reductase catalytic subunit
MGFSPAERDRVRRFWNAPRIVEAEGLKAVEMFDAIDRGTIKALWVMGTNPAVSMPRAGAVRDALKKLDLFVVSDNVLNTDTIAAGAHVLFPAAAWGEKDGTVTNSERRISRQRAFLPLPGEARPDWWIVSEVACRLGFADAFAYPGPADVFREHAGLSAFENEGLRDFDIGGLAALSDGAYRSLDAVMWPVQVGKTRGEKRFFAGGGFFTDDHYARFIAPQPPELRGATNAIYPLRLNTGRVRDQWHTMTRTGKSPRLAAHSSEPFVEINPADAGIAGVADGGFARVTTRHGTTILKVVVAAGQRRGSIFVPIHWSDANTGHARVGEMATAQADPYSGQPEAKATPARVEAVEFAYRGFTLTRGPITLPAGTWFARQAVVGGSGVLFATNEPPATWRDLAQQFMPADADIAEYIDERRGLTRVGAFRSNRLDGCIFVGPAHSLPRWDVVRGLFESGTLVEERDRRILLSGSDSDGATETGPIVCACFGVGLPAIREAVKCGATTVADVGQKLRAGTNCGSCIPELRAIIERVAEPA